MVLEHAQRKRHCVGRLVALFLLAIGSITEMAVGSRAQAETQYIPSVSLAQRYDSNVYFTAPQFVPQGKQSWDLITTLGAKVTVLNKSRLGDTVLRAGVDGNGYAYNSNLRYASANVLASSDLSDWTKELLPGLKLRITDAFLYSPQRPTFQGTGQAAAQAAQTAPQSDVFLRGVQGSSSRCIFKQLVHRRKLLLFAHNGSAR